MSEEPELYDYLMANGFVLRAFMLQVISDMARDKSDPKAWVKSFVSGMHEKIDFNEGYLGELGQKYPVHELARTEIDQVGLIVSKSLG